MTSIFSAIPIFLRLHQKFSKKPQFVLDENVHDGYGFFSQSTYLNARQFVKPGSPDQLLLERASKHNYTIITHDIRFVLMAITKNHDIIYEDHDNIRFLIKGTKTRIVDKNRYPYRVTYRRKKRVRRMMELASRTPFHLPLNGFYMVCFL